MRGSGYPEHPSLNLRAIVGLNMRMGGSGLSRSLIAIGISAMLEVADSIFPAVANLNVLLTIFATAGPIAPAVSLDFPDLDRDGESFIKLLKFQFKQSDCVLDDVVLCFSD